MRTLAVVALSTAALARASTAQEPVQFHLSQARDSLPVLVVYADLSDPGGEPIPALTPVDFSATVGERVATVLSVSDLAGSGEGTAYVFLLDISRSLNEQRFAEMTGALTAWFDAMGDADRAVILSFGDEVASIVTGFTGDKEALKTALEPLSPTDQTTSLYDAIARAFDYEQVSAPNLPPRRVIVVVSDGVNDRETGLTRDELIDQVERHFVPIYSIAYESSEGRTGFATLAELARRSGGSTVEGGSAEIARLVGDLRSRVERVSVLTIRCDSCVADGAIHRINLTYTSAAGPVAAGIDIRLLPSPVPVATPVTDPSSFVWWPWALAAGLVPVLGSILIWTRRRRRIVSVADPPLDDTTPGEGWIRDPPPPTPARAARVFWLTVARGPGAGDVHEVRVVERSVIGSGAGVDLRLAKDRKISSRQCEVNANDGALLLRDMQSLNGTAVNGVPVRTVHRLEDGDMILIGETELRVSFDRPEGG